MKKTYTLFIVLMCAINVFSQSSKTDAMLFGHVIDKATQKHLPYVTITVKGTNLATATDATGHFKLAHLPVGKQTVEAQLVGYKPQKVEVQMAEGKGTELYFELEEDVFNLDQVVVTGTRTQHYVKNVPVRTEVVTSQALKNKNAWNVFDALEGVPGIRVENQCQFCNFTMVRMQGLGAEHTQVLINGQPVYSGLASVYGLEQMGTGDVDRIEVVKGAGSALYGSSAVAGAINIITKDPSPVPSISADLQFGNHHTNVYNVAASMRNAKGTMGMSAYAQKIDHGVIDETSEGSTRQEVYKKDGISDRVASRLHNLGFNLFINDPLFGKDKIVFRGKAINEKREGGTITNDQYKNPFTEGTENITTDRYELEAAYNKALGGNSMLNFTNTYINHNRSATNDSFLGDYKSTHNDETPNVEDMRPYLATENSLVSTLTLGSKLGNHNVLVGVQNYVSRLNESGMYVVVDHESEFVGQAYKSTARKRANEIGAFIQDEWHVTDNVVVVPGVRVDYHKSGEEYTSDKKVFDQAFPKTSFKETSINPRLAIKYNLEKHWVFRANAGTGFRAPYGFSEDLHLCSGSPRVWKSSDLKAETSRSANLSADYYGHRFQVSANLFYTFLKNKIDFGDADDNVKALGYTYQWNNVDNAVVKGAEFTVLANPVRNLNLGVDFAFNHGTYKNIRNDWKDTKYADISKYIPRFPTTSGSFKVEYTPQSWNFTLNALYQGKMYIDYISETEANSKIKETKPYMTFNASVSKTFDRVRFYVGAKNIFSYVQDEKYLDDAAFMYAPVYGAMYYGGMSINISQ